MIVDTASVCVWPTGRSPMEKRFMHDASVSLTVLICIGEVSGRTYRRVMLTSASHCYGVFASDDVSHLMCQGALFAVMGFIVRPAARQCPNHWTSDRIQQARITKRAMRTSHPSHETCGDHSYSASFDSHAPETPSISIPRNNHQFILQHFLYTTSSF
jgi:hypothetical protein